MDFDGLNIVGEGKNNILNIDADCNFKRSKITVKGNDNVINLSKSLSYTNLVINLKGNNKKIEVLESSKNIKNLKIVSIRGNGQTIFIGQNFSCGGIEIQMNDGGETLKIGNGCLFSWGIKARTSDGHSVVDLNSGKAINLPKDVVIGNKVWVSEYVSFLKGSVISDESVVGSNAVVTKEFNEGNVVIAGFPAKVVKKDITWDRRMPSEYNGKGND